MKNFIDVFKTRGNYSFLGMREAAISLLPNDRSERDLLYDDLNRGKDILEDEDLLNMYLYSFGKMHKFKLVKAFVRLLELVNFDNEEIEIYDWGCGQGVATVCFLDCLKYLEIKPSIVGINLIDPSDAATERASEVIKCILSDCSVNIVKTDFDNLRIHDFKNSNVKKLHFFSNIIDVEAFSLSQLTKLMKHVFTEENFFICVGPCYNRERVDKFINNIEPDRVFYDIDIERGEWLNDWSVSIRVFSKVFPSKHIFHPILINKENVHVETISPIRTARDSDDNEFYYYWVTLKCKNKQYVCCTGEKFTESLGIDADEEKTKNVIENSPGKFEIAQALDEDGCPIYVNDDLNRPLLKIQRYKEPWIDNHGARYSRDWSTLLSGPNSQEVESMIINTVNFKKSDLTVSTLKKTDEGKRYYWCSFDNFLNGHPLLLFERIVDHLQDINAKTVWEVISNGRYIIREAHDEDDEWIMTEDNIPIMKITESQHYVSWDWDSDDSNASYRELDDVEKYSIKPGTTYILDNAFSCCKSLKIVDIPNSVKRVGRDIFKGCNSLCTIYIPYGTRRTFEKLLPDYRNIIVEHEPSSDLYVDNLPF